MNKFRKIAKFKYKNKRFQLLMSESNKTAFLEIKDGKYYYPELTDLIEINYLFNYNRMNPSIKKDKIKYYNLIPKAIRLGVLVTLSTSILSSCGNKYNSNTYTPKINDYQVTAQENEISTTEDNTETQNIKTDINNTQESNDDKYLKLLAAADDEYDFRYADDYQDLNYVKYLYVRDSKNYDKLYGYSMVSIDDIKKAVNSNKNINDDYKKFIIQYVQDWNSLYPGSDFSTLYHNLEGLQIKVCTKDEMARYTLSTNSVACYKRDENTIYVLNGIDLSRESSDYIVVAHELTHCARNATYKQDDGYKVYVSFYDDMNMGLYIEEALITDFCYQMQGLGNKSNFYTLQSSYFRIILDAIDYDGADFMNHSVNYLIDQMDKYMEDDQYAYHIITLIDAEAALRYTPYLEPEFEDFTDLYQYITRMYVKKNVTSDMTYEQTQEIYNNLVEELTYYFDQMTNPIELDLNIFEEEYNKCIEELGINENLSYGR